PWRPRRGPCSGPGWWTPHVATVSIGIAFLALLLLEGAWAYTDALAELARGMVMSAAARTALLACLLLGALWGGWRAGLLRAKAPSSHRGLVRAEGFVRNS